MLDESTLVEARRKLRFARMHIITVEDALFFLNEYSERQYEKAPNGRYGRRGYSAIFSEESIISLAQSHQEEILYTRDEVEMLLGDVEIALKDGTFEQHYG